MFEKNRGWLFISIITLSWIVSYAGESDFCEIAAKPYRVDLRHIEGKGVGYSQGYTTVAGFFTTSHALTSSWIPFLDLRAHIFNDGEPAANAGMGVRYLQASWLLGMNAYYDYRKTHTFHYNQFSLGLECLGSRWDFRLNGYLPLGKKNDYSEPSFSHFVANQLIISQKQEFAMKGGNAEAGYHFKQWRRIDFYAALGPYYFKGEGKEAIGGQGRIKAMIYDCLGLQVSGSYDGVFHDIIQGEVSLNFPLGPKGKVSKRKNYSCPKESLLRDRAVQRAERFEIIVTDRKKECFIAMNPCTGSPYRIVFVNNASLEPGGTFEAPYFFLLAAELSKPTPDIIYVYPGNGTDQGMNIGVMLQANQRLWSSSTAHCLPTCKGTVLIPQYTTTFPKISTSGIIQGGDFVVALSSNTEVSGFELDGSFLDPTGLLQVIDGTEGNENPSTLSNARVLDNLILVPEGATGIKFQHNHQLGCVQIENNTFQGIGEGITHGVVLENVTPVDLKNNHFINITYPIQVTP